MPPSLGVELRAAPTICFYLDMEFLLSCRSQLPHTSACWLWTRVSLFCKLYVAVLVPLVFEVYRPPPLESQYMSIPELAGTDFTIYGVYDETQSLPENPQEELNHCFNKTETTHQSLKYCLANRKRSTQPLTWNDQHMVYKRRFGKSFQLIEECVDLAHSCPALREGLHQEWAFDELLPQNLYHYVDSQWKGGCGGGRNFMLRPWNF